MANPNVLSERYATPEINAIFSDLGRARLEREFWVAVMKAQAELGLDIFLFLKKEYLNQVLPEPS